MLTFIGRLYGKLENNYVECQNQEKYIGSEFDAFCFLDYFYSLYTIMQD